MIKELTDKHNAIATDQVKSSIDYHFEQLVVKLL